MNDWMIIAAVVSILAAAICFLFSGHAALCLIKCEHQEGKGQ